MLLQIIFVILFSIGEKITADYDFSATYKVHNSNCNCLIYRGESGRLYSISYEKSDNAGHLSYMVYESYMNGGSCRFVREENISKFINE